MGWEIMDKARDLSHFGELGIAFMALRDEVSELKRKLEQAKPANKANKEYYNIKEAADYLNISTRSVRRLINRGLIKKSLGLGKIQIPRDSLDGYKKLTVNY